MIETKNTGAHAFLATLKANGVDTIFGLPGSTEAPLLEALREDASIRYILTLQENVTVAMADGYARAGRRVGVAGLHTSVGTMNGLSQIYTALRDNSPIVVTAGNKDSGVLSADGFCAVPDLPGYARDIAKYSWQTLRADDVASDLRRAINAALASPQGPAYLALPEDVQTGTVSATADNERVAYAGTATTVRRPDGAAVLAAARLLAQARRPILVLGASAEPFVAEARALADAFELPVFAIDRTQVSALPFPVRDPRYLGQYAEQRSLIEESDCVVVIGARAFFPFSSEGAAALPAGAKLIHAHADAEQLGWTIVPDVGLAGDAGAVLADLAAAAAQAPISAQQRADRIAYLGNLRAQYQDGNAKDRERHDQLARDAGAISLAHVADVLGAALSPGDLVFDEAVSSSRPLLRHAPFPEGSRVLRSNGGALGWALPAAVGGKLAVPDRNVVAVVGDGSFHFAPQALWTATQQRAPIVTIITDNSGYLAVKLAVERHLGVAKDERLHPGTELPSIDHLSVARGYGADALRIDDASQLEPALTAALRSERSTVIVVPVGNARR